MTTHSKADEFVPQDLTGLVVKLDDQYCATGSFGDVYKCKYRSMAVAVKTFRFEFQMEENSKNRNHARMIRRELGIWGRLSHPNVVPFLGTVCGFGRLGNTSLHDDALTVISRLQLLLDIANGLRYLHSLSIVHGDLSPNNVLLDENDNARLTDFGLASLVGETPHGLTYLQASTLRTGSLRWAAPERLPLDPDEKPRHTIKSDIFSFGSIALQVLSGKQPWSEKKSDTAILYMLSQGYKPSRPQSLPIDDIHWEFIEYCWSLVEDRPPAEHVVSTIQGFLHSPDATQQFPITTDHLLHRGLHTTGISVSFGAFPTLTRLYSKVKRRWKSSRRNILGSGSPHSNQAPAYDQYQSQMAQKCVRGLSRDLDSGPRALGFPYSFADYDSSAADVGADSGLSYHCGSLLPHTLTTTHLADSHVAPSGLGSRQWTRPGLTYSDRVIPNQYQNQATPQGFLCGYSLESESNPVLSNGSIQPSTMLQGPAQNTGQWDAWMWNILDETKETCAPSPSWDGDLTAPGLLRAFCDYDLSGVGVGFDGNSGGSNFMPLIKEQWEAQMWSMLDETDLTASGFLRSFDVYDFSGAGVGYDGSPGGRNFMPFVPFQSSYVALPSDGPAGGSDRSRRTFACRWFTDGEFCNSHVMSQRRSVVEHLQKTHGITLGDEKGRELCHWEQCRMTLNRESLARHILTTHLKEGARCPVCRVLYAREDSLQRHLKGGLHSGPSEKRGDSYLLEPTRKI